MKLTNLKLDPKAQEEKYAAPSVMADRPSYPWGLTVELNDDVLAAMGLTALPVVGSTMALQALVNVTEVSSRSEVGADGEAKECRRVCLQITDLGLGPAETDTSEKLYKK